MNIICCILATTWENFANIMLLKDTKTKHHRILSEWYGGDKHRQEGVEGER